jgi:uncharacterized membrane protein (DUF2068 family)
MLMASYNMTAIAIRKISLINIACFLPLEVFFLFPESRVSMAVSVLSVNITLSLLTFCKWQASRETGAEGGIGL